MEDHKPTSFTFEIDNFSEKEAVISSPTFSSGGCQWHAKVHPKENVIEDHLALYLHANSGSLQLGWKRRAKFSFVLLNQSGKEFYKSNELCQVFCAQVRGWGSTVKALTIEKLQEKGFMEKNKLIVKVQVQVLEVVNEAEVTGNETMDVRGFQVLYSQAFQVSWIFERHPDIALSFGPKSHFVKTTYMNLLLKLIEKLDKPPHSFTEIELSNAQSELIDLTEAGFELDWLKKKLDEISLEKKRGLTDGSRVQEIDELIKNLNLELEKEKEKSATCAAEVLLLEQTVSDLRVELRKEKKKSATSATEVLLLEQMVLDLRVELSKEKDKSATPNDLLEGVASWEVLDYADLYTNEKGEE